MKTFLASAVILVGIVASSCLAAQQEEKGARVLFVGNSLTYYNDLPSLFVEVINRSFAEVHVDVDLIAEGGASLADHLGAGPVQEVLTSGRYELIVVQGIGGWPLCPSKARNCADFEANLLKIAEIAKSSGTQFIWYSTWQTIPAAQEALSSRARQLSSAYDLAYADVGSAVHNFISSSELQEPLDESGHPTEIGSWIAAATLVRAIVNEPLPEPKGPARTCRKAWRGTGLKKDMLASAQPTAECIYTELTVDAFRDVVSAANKALHRSPAAPVIRLASEATRPPGAGAGELRR